MRLTRESAIRIATMRVEQEKGKLAAILAKSTIEKEVDTLMYWGLYLGADEQHLTAQQMLKSGIIQEQK